MAGHHGINFVALVAGESLEPIWSAALVSVLLIVVAVMARARLRASERPTVPDPTLTSKNFGDLLCLFVLQLSDNVMGKENRRYLPFVATIFLYVAALNLLGLIPGFSMPTDGLYFNFGIAITVFALYHYWGIREVGIVAYLKHFCGPLIWIAWMVVPIEIISHTVRPFSLTLRLFGNMTGDHLVLGAFTGLTKFGIPVVFYCLGTFVCLMQAFVFSLLTMIYIRFAVAHEHEEEGHEGAH